MKKKTKKTIDRLTWDTSNRRWKKFYKGRQIYLSRAGTKKSDREAKKRALAKWRIEKARIDGPPEPGSWTAWKGPVEDGITFSLLSRFVACRERFRLQVIEGLKEDEGFISAIEFGSLWHEAEEAYADGRPWEKAVDAYRDKLRDWFPTALEEIDKWTILVKLCFPLYVEFWGRHPFVRSRKPILQEKSFRVPYRLPSGRVLTLRGKFDAVWVKGKGIWLQENKTKGYIDEEGILKTLPGNLQVMIYQIALRGLVKDPDAALDGYQRDIGAEAVFRPDRKGKVIEVPQVPVKGVLYNVIRRPLSDRHSIRQRKAETVKDFLHRFRDTMAEDPGHHFMRWEAHVYNQDVKKFETEVLHPILEGLMDWWEWIAATDGEDPFRIDDRGIPGGGVHWATPWGVYNSMFGGFRGDFFELLSTGSKSKLIQTENLFPEL